MGLEKGLELERRPKKLAGTNGRQERRRERETRATTRAKDDKASIFTVSKDRGLQRNRNGIRESNVIRKTS